MSFVPAPQQANAASNNGNNSNALPPSAVAATGAVAAVEMSDQDRLFKIRTFDIYWVDKYALMYRDGIAKVCMLWLSGCCCTVQGVEKCGFFSISNTLYASMCGSSTDF